MAKTRGNYRGLKSLKKRRTPKQLKERDKKIAFRRGLSVNLEVPTVADPLTQGLR